MEKGHLPVQGDAVIRVEFLTKRKAQMKQNSIFGILGGILIIGANLHLAYDAVSNGRSLITFEAFFRFILVLVGFAIIFLGIRGLGTAKNLQLNQCVPSEDAIKFAKQLPGSTPYFTYCIVGGMIVVFLFQEFTGLQRSIEMLAFNKKLIFNNYEWWTVLTTTAIHNGVIHMLFHGNAIRGFGESIELYSNRAHMAIVFLLTSVGGSLISLLDPTPVPTVGAIGALLGLLGYLAVYAYLRADFLMPGFFNAMLINMGFLMSLGIFAMKSTDNYALFGGLLIGTVYGFIQIPRSITSNPLLVSKSVNRLGFVALIAFMIFCLVSILMMVGVIPVRA